jgi:hypothetical protein
MGMIEYIAREWDYEWVTISRSYLRHSFRMFGGLLYYQLRNEYYFRKT